MDPLITVYEMGGDAVDFSGSNVNLAMIEVGAKEVLKDALDSKLGRYLMPFENEKNGVTYPEP